MIRFLTALVLLLGFCIGGSNCFATSAKSSSYCQESEKCISSAQDSDLTDQHHKDSHCPVHCIHQLAVHNTVPEVSLNCESNSEQIGYTFIYFAPYLDLLKRPPLTV